MLSETLDLLHGDPAHWAAFLGVSVRQIRNYKSGTTALPIAALRLLRLRRRGDLAALLGDAWEGWSFSRSGLLYAPEWHNGIKPAQVRAMFFGFQELAALRGERLTWTNDTRAAQALRDLVALPPANDRYCPDDAQGNVLGARHSSLARFLT